MALFVNVLIIKILYFRGGPVREEAQPVRRGQDLQRGAPTHLRLDAPDTEARGAHCKGR